MGFNYAFYAILWALAINLCFYLLRLFIRPGCSQALCWKFLVEGQTTSSVFCTRHQLCRRPQCWTHRQALRASAGTSVPEHLRHVLWRPRRLRKPLTIRMQVDRLGLDQKYGESFLVHFSRQQHRFLEQVPGTLLHNPAWLGRAPGEWRVLSDQKFPCFDFRLVRFPYLIYRSFE